MAVIDFLRNGRKRVTVAHFDHGTSHGADARKFVEGYCKSKSIPLIVGEIQRERSPKESLEEYWRNERMRFFHNHISQEIITAHNLDDVVEWWMFTSLHGTPRLIPYRNKNIIKPFLITPKSNLVSWCERKKVPFLIDPSNFNVRFSRSRIRNNLLPEALKINPGLRTVIRKKIEQGI